MKTENARAQREAVNHPSHYNSGSIEVIDIIKDQLGDDGLRGFDLGNALKYIMRSGKKDPSKTVEDLKKAVWYLNHYIEFLEGSTKYVPREVDQ